MTPNTFPLVKLPLASNASAQPFDVVKMKSILATLGHYEAPDWGLSQFPDPALFDAIAKFQRARGLKVDGAMKPGGETEQTLLSTMNVGQATTAIRAAARALQDMGRGGDAILAHLTPEEARFLDAVTDGASVNPATGLLEFRYGGSGSYRGHTKTGASSDRGDSDSSYDASKDHKVMHKSVTTLGVTTRGDSTGADAFANPGGQSVPNGFDASADYKARQNEIAAAMKANNEQQQTQARRARTVLTPDNDPSFTAGFFEAKSPPSKPAVSEETSSPVGPRSRPNNRPVRSRNWLGDALNDVANTVEDGYIGVTSWHFEDRDLLNSPLPGNEQQAVEMGFRRYSDERSIYHQNNKGKSEKKYGHPDGREVVFDGDTGRVVSDPRYKGTYNYETPSPMPDNFETYEAWRDYLEKGGGHIVKDVAPYWIGGNVRGRF